MPADAAHMLGVADGYPAVGRAGVGILEQQRGNGFAAVTIYVAAVESANGGYRSGHVGNVHRHMAGGVRVSEAIPGFDPEVETSGASVKLQAGGIPLYDVGAVPGRADLEALGEPAAAIARVDAHLYTDHSGVVATGPALF